MRENLSKYTQLFTEFSCNGKKRYEPVVVKGKWGQDRFLFACSFILLVLQMKEIAAYLYAGGDSPVGRPS